MRIWLDSERIDVAPGALLGQGGEADVYDLADGRVLKLFKRPDHGDLAGLPDEQAAAAARLAAMQDKLPAFPRNLPTRVVAPGCLASQKKRGEVVGYAMPRVAGVALAHLADLRWRRDHAVDTNTVVAALRDLAATVAAVHAAGVVIGDFNDLNVLVDGERAWLIDADSMQFGRWRCPVFTERFVDPRLCDPTAPAPALTRPHDRDSDVFALAVMVFRSLLGVGPYGGVHQPADPAQRVAASLRARRGITVFDPAVVYPRAAVPWTVLPDELLAYFDEIFARGRRGAWPSHLLDRLRWTRCARCGAEHARTTCPSCRPVIAALPATTSRLRTRRLAPSEVAPQSWTVGRRPVSGAPPVWLDGGALWRSSAAGAEPIGQILSGATHAWVGRRFGVGMWRAGGYQVAFAFRPDRRGLDERVALPRVRGHLVAAFAIVADDRAWVFVREVHAGRETVACSVVADTGATLATLTVPADDASWLVGAAGACAAGPFLFVPTDLGIVRVEVSASTLVVARRFPETAELVCAGDELVAGTFGLAVRRPDGAIALELS